MVRGVDKHKKGTEPGSSRWHTRQAAEVGTWVSGRLAQAPDCNMSDRRQEGIRDIRGPEGTSVSKQRLVGENWSPRIHV